MSSFTCEKCSTVIVDTPQGYITECSHYLLEKPDEKLSKAEKIEQDIISDQFMQ